MDPMLNGTTFQTFCHIPDPVFRKLRVLPQDVPAPPIPSLPDPGSRFVRAAASRGPRDSAARTPQSSEGNGYFRQSASSTSPKSNSWPEGVAPPSQHLHDSSLIQIGCSSSGILRCDWLGLHLSLSSRTTSIHAYPSGIPCQPPGIVCGQHIPGSRRGPPSPNPIFRFFFHIYFISFP